MRKGEAAGVAKSTEDGVFDTRTGVLGDLGCLARFPGPQAEKAVAVRIFSRRCHAYEYTLTAPSPSAVRMGRSAMGMVNAFSDCLVVTITVEPGDCELTGVAAKLIRRIAGQSKATSIVLDGRMSPPTVDSGVETGADLLVQLADALDVLADITEMTIAGGDSVHLMPYGWYSANKADLVDVDQAERLVHLCPRGIRRDQVVGTLSAVPARSNT